MRLLLLVFAVWLAIALTPEHPVAAGGFQETIYPSHTCAHSSWYVVSSDADSVTVECYEQESNQ